MDIIKYVEDVLHAFRVFDRDGDGYIDYKEMHKALRNVEDAQSEVNLFLTSS